MLSRKARRLAAALAATGAIAGGALLSGCGSSSEADVQFGGSAYPGVDLANTRHVDGAIKRANAGELEVAWSLPLSAQSSFGAYAASPVVSQGVVYSQDLESNVQAINIEDGEVQWTKKFNEPTLGPNGVVVADGKVFGATASEAFALDQETGKQLWATPLIRSASESITMAPGYDDGMVYVSTVPTNSTAQYPAGGVGVLWALDAKSGAKKWKFATVPESLWGDPKTNAGGGLWYPPSFDGQGFVYFGVGNPAPFPGTAKDPWGSSRPGPNLYTNSMVKLDAKTGKLKWFHQVTPHDVYDWDFQDSPILTEAGGRQLAIGAGKSGIVVAIDRKTGKPVWERPVGQHSGHDDDGLLAMRGEYSKLKPGSTVAPGTLGGVIAPMAANETTLFVPVVNHPIAVSKSGAEIQESQEMTGEMVALDIATGKVEWNQEYPAAAFGAPTAVNDMVFFTTFDGIVHGLDASSGGEVWQGTLPAASNTAVAIDGDTLLVPAGLPTEEGQRPELIAYRLGG